MGLVNVLYTSKGSSDSTSSDNPVFTGSMSINRKADTKIGTMSVAEGNNTEASGDYSHAEGSYNLSSGFASHAEGNGTTASGMDAHAEGGGTKAYGDFSHAEGSNAEASGTRSHAEGSNTKASDEASHAEGNYTISSGLSSHAEGNGTTASGDHSHTEGRETTASGLSSHAEGAVTMAYGTHSHAEGAGTTASGFISHAEGAGTIASGFASHAEGANDNTVDGVNFIPLTNEVYAASGHASHKEGINTIAKGMGSHAEGILGTVSITADGKVSSITELNADQLLTVGAVGVASHVEGINTTASGSTSHAEGDRSKASGSASHAEGVSTTASGYHSHAEGTSTTASGGNSHAEGYNTEASGLESHAEGSWSKASGGYSHAGGYYSNANSNSSFAHGLFLEMPEGKDPYSAGAVFGICNNINTMTDSIFVIGGGSMLSRSNVLRITRLGQVYSASTYNTGGADFAEIYEWEDGNTKAEDRRGLFVTNNIEKITIAQPGDYILGAISSNPCIVGNSSEDWNDRWIKDIFGNIITEEVEVDIMDMIDKEIVTEDSIISETIIDKDGNEMLVEKTIPGKVEIVKEYGPTGEKKVETINKQNPDYNPDQIYVGRADRKEWDYVGLHGQIVMIDDGTCEINGFCKPAVGGIATKANTHNGYRVLNRLDDTHIKIQMESIRIFDYKIKLA